MPVMGVVDNASDENNENTRRTGKYDPSLWLAYDIAQLFNMSIEEVFNFKESERK